MPLVAQSKTLQHIFNASDMYCSYPLHTMGGPEIIGQQQTNLCKSSQQQTNLVCKSNQQQTNLCKSSQQQTNLVCKSNQQQTNLCKFIIIIMANKLTYVSSYNTTSNSQSVIIIITLILVHTILNNIFFFFYGQKIEYSRDYKQKYVNFRSKLGPKVNLYNHVPFGPYIYTTHHYASVRACASEVYGSVRVCVCVCVNCYSCSVINEVQVCKSF